LIRHYKKGKLDALLEKQITLKQTEKANFNSANDKYNNENENSHFLWRGYSSDWLFTATCLTSI